MVQRRRSDTELIRAAQRGEQEAWDTLVERYSRLVYAIPQRVGLSPDSAVRVFHAVFSDLLDNLDRMKDTETLVTYLLHTTTLESKRLRRGVTLSPHVDALSTIGGVPVDDATVERWQDQQTIREAVAQLPGRCQRLLNSLLQNRPASDTEIARRLNIPQSRVSAERARCFEALRAILEAWGFESH